LPKNKNGSDSLPFLFLLFLFPGPYNGYTKDEDGNSDLKVDGILAN
jgi:hypothetical protein